MVQTWLKSALLQQADQLLALYQCQQQESIAAALQPLFGAHLKLELVDLKLELVFQLAELVQLIHPSSEQNIDCSLKCRSTLLPELKQPSQLPELIKSGELELEGNIQIASKVAEILAQTQFDSEEWLSGFMGDVPAHLCCAGLSKFKRWANYRAEQTRLDVTEWLMDEVRWLPYSAEFRQHNLAITALIDQVDALEGRIQRLAQKLS